MHLYFASVEAIQADVCTLIVRGSVELKSGQVGVMQPQLLHACTCMTCVVFVLKVGKEMKNGWFRCSEYMLTKRL